MPIESNPIIPSSGLAGLRPVGTVDARTVKTAVGVKDPVAVNTSPDAVASPAATFQPSQALDPGQAPVDVERVQVIRHAIETGNYPVIPTKIADAIIAARLLMSRVA